MRFHARQGYARQVERVDPRVFQQRVAARMLRREVAVEFRVVCDQFRVAHERDQLRQRLFGARGIGHVLVVDVGEVHHVFGDGFPWVDEGDEPVGYFAALHARGGYLCQFVVIERETRRFGVDDDDVAIQIPIVGLRCRFRKGRIPRAYGQRRPVAYEILQSFAFRGIVRFHTVQPIIYYGIAQIENMAYSWRASKPSPTMIRRSRTEERRTPKRRLALIRNRHGRRECTRRKRKTRSWTSISAPTIASIPLPRRTLPSCWERTTWSAICTT